MDRRKGRYWAAFALMCMTLAWLTINIVWWTRTRQSEDLAVPAALFVLGGVIFYRECRLKK